MKTLYSAAEERAPNSTWNANAVSIVTDGKVKKCTVPLMKQSPSVDYYQTQKLLSAVPDKFRTTLLHLVQHVSVREQKTLNPHVWLHRYDGEGTHVLTCPRAVFSPAAGLAVAPKLNQLDPSRSEMPNTA